MNPEEFARSSWQASAPATTLPPIEELRHKADKFHRRIRFRNAIEYAAGIFLIISFGGVLLLGPMPWHEGPFLAIKLGSALALAGVLVVMWQLRRRAAPLTPPKDGGQLSVLEFQRREFVRQRDALRSIFSWYLAPLIPGMLVFMAAPFLAVPAAQWQWPPLGIVVRLAFAPAMFVGIWWLNQVGARKLQAEIDAIDALRE